MVRKSDTRERLTFKNTGNAVFDAASIPQRRFFNRPEVAGIGDPGYSCIA